MTQVFRAVDAGKATFTLNGANYASRVTAWLLVYGIAYSMEPTHNMGEWTMAVSGKDVKTVRELIAKVDAGLAVR